MGGGSVPTPKPIRMPVADDPAILAAKARQQALVAGQQGRQSTILSDALQSVNGSAGKLGA